MLNLGSGIIFLHLGSGGSLFGVDLSHSLLHHLLHLFFVLSQSLLTLFLKLVIQSLGLFIDLLLCLGLLCSFLISLLLGLLLLLLLPVCIFLGLNCLHALVNFVLHFELPLAQYFHLGLVRLDNLRLVHRVLNLVLDRLSLRVATRMSDFHGQVLCFRVHEGATGYRRVCC